MRVPPIPLPSVIRLQLMKKGTAGASVSLQTAAGQSASPAVRHAERMEESKTESRVQPRSSFGGSRGMAHARSKSEHALVPLHTGPRVVGCTDPALLNVLLNVLQQEKRQSILSYGSYSIHIVRVQNHKLMLLLESAPNLLEQPVLRDLFLGRPAGGLRFSAAQKPVRSQLGGVETHE